MPTIDNWRTLREALDAGPTGGRWRWEINLENKRLHLVGGPYREFDLTIMDFDRWGMGGAVATLRDTSVDGMNIMHRLPDRKDWVAPFPGRAHHANWCQQVTHPDMRWIQEASPKVIRSLLDERDRLASEVEALRGDVVVVIDGHNIRPADVLRRIIRNLKIKKGRTAWGVVSDLTAHGSTVSAGLCEWAGIEPDSGHRLTQP